MGLSRILIIEDEETLAENLKIFLGRHAFDVRIAPEGDAAMEILQTFIHDVVVFDYSLPEIDGLQAYMIIVRAPRTLCEGHSQSDISSWSVFTY